MQNKPLAVIDIGTNTFRLLIAEVLSNPDNASFSFNEIISERLITRLGEGMQDTGLLSNEAMTRGLNALKHFRDLISNCNVYKTAAIATSALRNAENSGEFLRKAMELTGLDLEIISGSQEATLTASGILMDKAPLETALMIDIGGGSTELILTRGTEPELVSSLDLGVVYLSDMFMKNDPPSNNDIRTIDEEISRRIVPISNSFRNLITNRTLLIGTAGTITSLAATAQHLTKYKHDKIHNFRLTIEKVNSIITDITHITSEERAKYFSFEPERLDIIMPGTLILHRLMKTFGFNELTVSNYGLREGILIDLYCKIYTKK